MPPVAHANFGRNKLYFMRDRRVWFVENLTERFSEPVHKDEYFPAAALPQDLFHGEADPFAGGSTRVRFLRYGNKAKAVKSSKSRLGEGSDKCVSHGVEANSLACHFLELLAALEVAVWLGRRLILPNSFNCSWSPMWEVYGMRTSFRDVHEDCTFDYFADAESFIKRFGHLLVEASFVKSEEFAALSKRSKMLRLDRLDLAEPRELRQLDASVLEVEGSVLALRDSLRDRYHEFTALGRALFPCKWIEFEAWFYARRPDQPAAVGSSRCGVQGHLACSYTQCTTRMHTLAACIS